MSLGDQLDIAHQQLSWHVPVEERSLLRTKALRMVFAGLICLGVIVLFGSRSFRLAALLGAIPFAFFVAWRIRTGARRRGDSADNVRIDDEGLHWRDDQGGERRIARDQIEGFRIGIDPDTIRALPALTLIFAGGFESQPLEIHAPVAPSHVRHFLVDQLKIDESPPDEVFAARLHDALAVACEDNIHLPEMRVLQCGLIDPERLPDGTWRLAQIADGCEVIYLPATCGYQCRHGLRSVDLADIAQLAEHIRGEILAKRVGGWQKWLAALEQQRNQRVDLAVRREASRLGFYIEIDPEGRLHLEGSKTGLLGLCDRIADAAGRLRKAPCGARPAAMNVGTGAVRLNIMLDEVPWCDEAMLAGPRWFLLAVAEQLRERIRGEPGKDFLVKVPHDVQPQLFCVHLRGEHYDPLAEVNAVADARRQA